MNITVNGKEYTIEYTFEAAHNKKCVDVCWNYFSGAYMVKGTALDELDNSETVGKVATIDKMIDTMSDIPDMVITLLYAGLLEHHGPDSDDPVIITGKDARSLYKQFCKENPESDLASDMEMFNAIKGQMEVDGFFKRIGLEEFLRQMGQTEDMQKKAPKKPADHQKKTTGRSGN
nr:MAG TPA: tail assembly chaperone protein [Bacteriophage sp.]